MNGEEFNPTREYIPVSGHEQAPQSSSKSSLFYLFFTFFPLYIFFLVSDQHKTLVNQGMVQISEDMYKELEVRKDWKSVTPEDTVVAKARLALLMLRARGMGLGRGTGHEAQNAGQGNGETQQASEVVKGLSAFPIQMLSRPIDPLQYSDNIGRNTSNQPVKFTTQDGRPIRVTVGGKLLEEIPPESQFSFKLLGQPKIRVHFAGDSVDMRTSKLQEPSIFANTIKSSQNYNTKFGGGGRRSGGLYYTEEEAVGEIVIYHSRIDSVGVRSTDGAMKVEFTYRDGDEAHYRIYINLRDEVKDANGYFKTLAKVRGGKRIGGLTFNKQTSRMEYQPEFTVTWQGNASKTGAFGMSSVEIQHK